MMAGGMTEDMHSIESSVALDILSPEGQASVLKDVVLHSVMV